MNCLWEKRGNKQYLIDFNNRKVLATVNEIVPNRYIGYIKGVFYDLRFHSEENAKYFVEQIIYKEK